MIWNYESKNVSFLYEKIKITPVFMAPLLRDSHLIPSI